MAPLFEVDKAKIIRAVLTAVETSLYKFVSEKEYRALSNTHKHKHSFKKSLTTKFLDLCDNYTPVPDFIMKDRVSMIQEITYSHEFV